VVAIHKRGLKPHSERNHQTHTKTKPRAEPDVTCQIELGNAFREYGIKPEAGSVTKHGGKCGTKLETDDSTQFEVKSKTEPEPKSKAHDKSTIEHGTKREAEGAPHAKTGVKSEDEPRSEHGVNLEAKCEAKALIEAELQHGTNPWGGLRVKLRIWPDTEPDIKHITKIEGEL
jgi:hypothetical protein